MSNIGDGQLNLTVTSSVSWLTGFYMVVLPSNSACGGIGTNTCIAINFNTSALAQGTYTGVLTVFDPNALDTPQIITVTVYIGSTIPDHLDLYAPVSGPWVPSIYLTIPCDWTGGAGPTSSWLVLYVPPDAGCQDEAFPNVSYDWATLYVSARPEGLAAGDYKDSVTWGGSAYTADNKTVDVDFHVTASPIVDTFYDLAFTNAPVLFTVSLPVGPNAAQTQYFWIGNDGLGTLSVSDVQTATDSGSWLSATSFVGTGGVGISITADPTGLAANAYNGTVMVNSNAANSSTVISVELDVIAPGPPPEIVWPRILNVATYEVGDQLAQGDIVALFGTHLHEGDPLPNNDNPLTLPLPTQLGETQVLVNGTPAPLFYAGYGQINFQMPFEEPAGADAQIQVVRGGLASSIGTVSVVSRAPELLQLGCPFANFCDDIYYAIAVNASDGSFPWPDSTPFSNAHPAKVGDVLTFYAVGLGQTTNPLTTGAPAPSNPLPTLSPGYQVCFTGVPNCQPALYSGATPTYVGLYQINVEIPAGASGDVGVTITDGRFSSSGYSTIAVQ